MGIYCKENVKSSAYTQSSFAAQNGFAMQYHCVAQCCFAAQFKCRPRFNCNVLNHYGFCAAPTSPDGTAILRGFRHIACVSSLYGEAILYASATLIKNAVLTNPLASHKPEFHIVLLQYPHSLFSKNQLGNRLILYLSERIILILVKKLEISCQAINLK